MKLNSATIMIEFFRYKIADFIVKNNLKAIRHTQLFFSDWFDNSFSFFVIMPLNEIDFRDAFSVLEFLDKENKTLTVFTNDFKVALLPYKFRNKTFSYSNNEISKLKLPSKELIRKLQPLSFDVTIDLNREVHLFSSFVANLVKSKIRIGIDKKKSTEYYNLIFSGNELDKGIFYLNFLNFLKMF